MRQVVLLSILIAILLSGCALAPRSQVGPSWLDRPYDAVYGQGEYLVAVGSGSTREQAVDAARAALSQIFASEVQSVTELTTRSTSAVDEAGSSAFTQASEMLEMGRVSSTTEAIIASEVANVYTDALGRTYARVVMHRTTSAALYRSEVQALAQQRASLKARRLGTSEALGQYILLLEELALARREQGFLDQIQVLTAKSQGSVLLPLQRELGALASTITISLSVDAPAAAQGVLAAAFEAALQALGFVTVTDGGAYTMDVHYRSEEVVMENSPYHYVRYSLTSQLKKGDVVYLSYQGGGREAAFGASEAEARALRIASGDGVTQSMAQLLQTLAAH